MKKCIIDIDGVLNMYPQTYIDYVNVVKQTSFVTLDEVKNGLSYKEYAELKKLYRTSGIKERLQPRSDACMFLKYLRHMGYTVIILSSRPVEVYNDLIFQTTRWLAKNELVYDFLDFGYRKHINIIEKFGDIDFVIDDNSEIAISLVNYVGNVYLMKNECNKDFDHGGVIKVDGFSEIVRRIEANEQNRNQ
jgi:uncharacterized HAD superfamily protein